MATPNALTDVNTAKAKTKIIAYLRKEKRGKITRGEKMLKTFLEKNDLIFDTTLLNKLLTHYCLKKKEDLFLKIGGDEVETDETMRKLLKDKGENLLMKYFKMAVRRKDDSSSVPHKDVTANKKPIIDRKETYILREVNGVKNYSIAACCKPIPGDDVLGYVNENENVIVHKRSCQIATKLKSSFGQRIISAKWADHNEISFSATIEIKGIDGVGVLNKITGIISDNMAVNIKNITIDVSDGIFDGKITIMVHDVQEVEKLCYSLKQLPNVKSANRINEAE